MKTIEVRRNGGPEGLQYSDLASPTPKASRCVGSGASAFISSTQRRDGCSMSTFSLQVTEPSKTIEINTGDEGADNAPSKIYCLEIVRTGSKKPKFPNAAQGMKV